MIDIESMDRDALIAEIRRLRGIDNPNGHRRCKCGSVPHGEYSRSRPMFWIACCDCGERGPKKDNIIAAWAAWDGVEG